MAIVDLFCGTKLSQGQVLAAPSWHAESDRSDIMSLIMLALAALAP